MTVFHKVWWYYWLFIVGRLCLIASPGYIHPDEFFQSGQELLFGLDSSSAITWEWQPQHAIRSIVPPVLMAGLPLYVYAFFKGCLMGKFTLSHSLKHITILLPSLLSGGEILIIPRLFLALMSIYLIDTTIAEILDLVCINNESSLFHLATSWPMLLLMGRPFTNSLEAMFVALLIRWAVQDWVISKNALSSTSIQSYCSSSNRRFRREIWLGVLCAVAIFTRITFLFFAIPIMVFIVGNRSSTLLHCIHFQKYRSKAKVRSFISCIPLVASISFVLTSLFTVFLDTLYYHNQSQQTTRRYRLVITPLNFFFYNSDPKNLLQHGLHPHITHLFVNLPLLFGPLVIPFVTSLTSFTRRISRPIQLNDNPPSTDTRESTLQSYIQKLSIATILTSLSLLSCSPHQEPRFLLPLITPLVLLHALDKNSPSIHLLVSMAFHGMMLLFFGFFHQAGVVPSLLAFNNLYMNNNSSLMKKHIIYFHTYMPPTFLLRTMQQSTNDDMDTCGTGPISSCYEHQRLLPSIQDLKGSTLTELKTALLRHAPDITETCGNSHQPLFLVAPSLVLHGDSDGTSPSTDCPLLSDSNIVCKSIWSHYQFSGEDHPSLSLPRRSIFDSMRLIIYQVEYLN